MVTMIDLNSIVGKQLQTAKKFYVSDINALSEEKLVQRIGNARSPYDFSYEVVMVNRRIAARLRGEDPGDWPFEGWSVAPDEFCNKATATKEVEDSLTEVEDAIGADASRTVTTPEGDKSAFEIGSFAALHVMYHGAQLNYIQAMGGDVEVHWEN